MANNEKINLYDLSRKELGTVLAQWNYSDYYAGLIWQLLYRQRVKSLDELDDLRSDLSTHLLAKTDLNRLKGIVSLHSNDGFTRKYLLAANDGQSIETVLMHFSGRATACISTQVGCAMGCIFCATGQMGFTRHLSPGEIIAQVLHVMDQLEPNGGKVRNIVIMGMGEPLHNYDATMAAVDTLIDDSGLAFGPRYITLSTVGIPPAIRRLADEGRPINLAVSLHAATDEERSILVPAGRRWPLDELLDACHYYVTMRDRRIFIEWALIAGQNDSPEKAHTLGRLLSGLQAHVNLIPLNLTSDYGGRPSDDETTRRFQSILIEYGLPSTVRQRRGLDIDAGCGQLRSSLTNSN